MLFYQEDLIEATMKCIYNLFEQASVDNGGEDLPYWIDIRFFAVQPGGLFHQAVDLLSASRRKHAARQGAHRKRFSWIT